MEQARKNSSTSTIMSMFNTMVGGAMLTFPVFFRDVGIASSFLILTTVCLICYATCRVFLLHCREDEDTVQDVIRRLIGNKAERIWRVFTGVYLMFICVIYIQLIVDQMYAILVFIFDRIGKNDSIAEKDTFVWGKFSQQWLTVVMFIPFLASLFIKNIGFLYKVAGLGAYCVAFYFLFVAYKFIDGLVKQIVDWQRITWFTLNVGNLSGTAAMAFNIHTVVLNFMKFNRKQANNMRDLKVSYLLTYLLYTSVGVLGGIAIQDRKCQLTLVNCYLTEWLILAVEVSYFLSTIALFPCIAQISRTRLLTTIYDDISPSQITTFNISFMILGSTIAILSPFIPVTLTMNFTGAVICYVFVYLYPTLMHLRCFYHNHTAETASLLSTSVLADGEISEQTCGHRANYAEKRSKFSRFMLWAVFNIVGLTIGVYGLYSVVYEAIKQT